MKTDLNLPAEQKVTKEKERGKDLGSLRLLLWNRLAAMLNPTTENTPL
jgi:hypothetical protein